MDKERARVQKYVSRFCSLLDDLLTAYKNETANTDRHRTLATRAQFLGCKLGLLREPDWECRALLAPLGWFSPDLSKDAHDQRYVQQQIEYRAQREKRIGRFQAEAKSLVGQGLTLEVAPEGDRTNLAEDVKEFCGYIDQIIEIYEMPHDNPEIHRFGKRANKLAMKIGLTCQDRPLALACHILRSEDKIPYVEKGWWDISRIYANELDPRPVDRWRAWQKRAKSLLEASRNEPAISSPFGLCRNKDIATDVAHYDFFISHASEDKDDFVRPLAQSLTALGATVWYDEIALTVGDSLRRCIDSGLRNSRFGIIVLSKSFFGKNWPQRELDALVSREIEEDKVILPIWHGVTKEEVSQYSPILADKIALVSTSMNVGEIAARLLRELSK